MINLMYSPFHKTLPRSSFLMHWISVRFYEMGDTWKTDTLIKKYNIQYMLGRQALLITHIIYKICWEDRHSYLEI